MELIEDKLSSESSHKSKGESSEGEIDPNGLKSDNKTILDKMLGLDQQPNLQAAESFGQG